MKQLSNNFNGQYNSDFKKTIKKLNNYNINSLNSVPPTLQSSYLDYNTIINEAKSQYYSRLENGIYKLAALNKKYYYILYFLLNTI